MNFIIDSCSGRVEYGSLISIGSASLSYYTIRSISPVLIGHFAFNFGNGTPSLIDGTNGLTLFLNLGFHCFSYCISS